MCNQWYFANFLINTTLSKILHEFIRHIYYDMFRPVIYQIQRGVIHKYL